MDTLPVELLRLIYTHCEPESVRSLRGVSVKLADIGYDYLLSPQFTSVSWRNDIDRLHCIALHERLRGSITSICIFLGDLNFYDAGHSFWYDPSQHFVAPPEVRNELMGNARREFDRIEQGRMKVGPFHLRADDLREACSALPNLKDLEVSFTRCPLKNQILQDVFDWPNCRRKLERPETYSNLDAIISALHGIRLNSFKVDRLPLEVFRLPGHRTHWFTHAQSFDSLSTLDLTLDPSGLQGPSSSFKAVNGLGRMLQLATQLRKLKLAFHPYTSEHSKFALSFRELLFGFTYKQLTDLALEGVSCDEDDLKEFLGRHGDTLLRLRLGGRGLAKPFEVSLGGVHLWEGTFKSLFRGLRVKLPKLERLHLEGIFECEHQDLPSHEAYNFYPLTNDDWEDVPRPRWVRTSRKTINCLPFEQYVLCGGVYPGNSLIQQNY
ncbi:Uu.00g048620.m01.CDS01 [Anthostomella pinea]|uniref:Uu.00g048620.m01.CDS01 n=1 Tax=Anthostomella pinea TaxID=933095 RepID=A0AAI8VBR8_9PEZI|nr:Uu.00g048620.m01.CDS01 [Anthostomella pinea]